MKDHPSAILGEDAGDENVVGMREDVARGIFISRHGGPEEGCHSVKSGARNVEEEGMEEVGEASIGKEKGRDIWGGLEVRGDQEQELVGKVEEGHGGRCGCEARLGG